MAGLNFNVNVLRYILEVSKTGSISKAAENLFLSQPYLSNVINTFEKNLGFKLFVRVARGVRLTDEGAGFIRQAKDIVGRLDSFEEKYFYEESNSLQLRISMTRSYQITRKILDYINKNQGKERVLIRIRETNPFDVVRDVAERISDFGVLHYFDVQKDYFKEMYRRYGLEYDEDYNHKYLLCISKDNPLVREKHIEKAMLAEQLAVLYGDYETPDSSYEYISEVSEILFSRKKLYVYDRATALEALHHCPMSYMWITGLHEDTLKQYDLVLRECADVNVRNIGSKIYCKNEKLSKEAKAVLKVIDGIKWGKG